MVTAPRLYGPLALTAERIGGHLMVKSPGIYALGLWDHGTFLIKQIGRSDEDLRAALQPHVGGPYREFKFSYAVSPRDAFEKECRLFHELVTLDDPTHPTAPKDTDVKCPGCGTVGRAGGD